MKPSSFLGIIPMASQTKFHQIRITKSKVIPVQIPQPKWEKTKKWDKRDYIQGQLYWFQNRAKRLKIEAYCLSIPAILSRYNSIWTMLLSYDVVMCQINGVVTCDAREFEWKVDTFRMFENSKYHDKSDC